MQGEVFDVAVDIRVGSPTFGKWTGVVLSGENHRQLWVPPGFAHGFCVLSDTTYFTYKCTDVYTPSAVIHCAAYTNVDSAESDGDGAFRVNVVGAQNIAAGCLETGARMVYVSTDYVFDGQRREPYREFDQLNPQSVYGHTKRQGEDIVRQILGRHYIVRTAWLYGDGKNFVRTMLKLAETNDTLRVVHDQVGTPTSTVDLTRVIFNLLASDAYGTYHATCQGQCSWYDFACEIFKQAGKDVKVVPVTTSEFPRPAKRPMHSVLDNYMLRMTVGDPMREWQDALREYLIKT